MPETLDIAAFLQRAHATPVVDVRSPAEFAQGHIPGAVNVPISARSASEKSGTFTAPGM